MATGGLTVLGGGNTAFSVAANLALAGAEVTLCEIAGFEAMIDPIRETKRIQLEGVARRGPATLAHVTQDFRAALAANDLVLLIVPAYAHHAFAEATAPHLRAGQMLVLMPGTLGTLEFAELLRQRGAGRGVILAETDTAPYVCRKTAPTVATIWGVVGGMGLGVFPAEAGARVQRAVEPWFPGVQLYPHVLACGLAAMNPVVHPAGVLLNAGRIERSRGDFYFYDEGVTPGVCRLIESVDGERRAIAAALGLELPPVDGAFHSAGFGPRGDLWATINGSRMLTQLRAPGALETRWVTEDVPYGVAAWAALGEQLGISCPVMRSLVTLTSAMLGIDFNQQTRTPQRLGIAGKSRDELLDYVTRGTL